MPTSEPMRFITPKQPQVVASLLPAGCAELQVGHAQAELKQHPPGWEHLQPAQQRELAQVRRRWELQTHSRRVFILQVSERCIRSAFTAEAYRACKRQERQASFSLRLEGLQRINRARAQVGLTALLDPQLDLSAPRLTAGFIKKAAPSGAASA